MSRFTPRPSTVGGRIAVAALILGAAGTGLAGTASATEMPAGCTSPVLSGGSASAFDSTVNVYAGGDFTVKAGAEAEGVVTVDGNLSVAGHYNVGVAGLGSQIRPPVGSVMLAVGGDVSGGGPLDVGNPDGGAVNVGGTVAPGTIIYTNGGGLSQGLGHDAALASLAHFADQLPVTSASYATLSVTGAATTSGSSLSLTGDNASAQQVFSIPGSDLGSAGSPVSVTFAGIPSGATVVVDVTGPVSANVSSFFAGGQMLDANGDAQALATYATHTLWNVVDAANPTFAGGAQWPGAILVPNATGVTTIKLPGTNGHVYVAGDLVQNYGGGEFHNYPFAPWNCPSNVPTPSPSATTPVAPFVPVAPTPGPSPTIPPAKPTTPAADVTPTPSPSTSVSPTPTGTTTAPAPTVAPSATKTPSGGLAETAPAVASTTPTSTAAAHQGGLAETGAAVLPVVALALVLLLAGGVLVLVRRSRA